MIDFIRTRLPRMLSIQAFRTAEHVGGIDLAPLENIPFPLAKLIKDNFD